MYNMNRNILTMPYCMNAKDLKRLKQNLYDCYIGLCNRFASLMKDLFIKY